MSEVSSDKRCRRNDGRGWRCKLSAVEGRGYCERHLTQGILRKKRQPVPDHLKFERARRGITPKVEPQELEQGSNEGEITDLPSTRTRAAGNKRMRTEDEDEEASDNVVVDMHGALDPDIVGCGSSSISESPVKRLPSNIKQNVKATAKKKINNKCHWCRLSSYRVLVKCSTCKKQYFCEDCIDKRFHCKNTIMRKCPVCLGECTCQACTKAKPKKVKTKEPVNHEVDEDAILCDPETETDVCNHENELEKIQQLHIIGEPVIYEVDEDVIRDPENEMNVCTRENELEKSQRVHIIGNLLPVIEKMHQEIMKELDTEAKDRGKSHNQIKVQFPKYPRNKECSFCKGCITVVQRSCDRCGYVFCLSCCEDYRNGNIHARLKNLKTTKCVRTKKSINVSWKLASNGSIICPPKNLGGCGDGVLNLSSFSPLGFAKILGDNAKIIMGRENTFKKDACALSISSTCSLCDDDIAGLRFCTKKEFVDMDLEHFKSHWGKGKPVIIPNVVFKDLNWDFGFLLCEYLKKGVKSSEVGPVKGVCDWLDVNFGSKRIISRGKSENVLKEFANFKNVMKEFVKFDLRLPGGFLKDKFPSYYEVILKCLPIQEYLNPINGSHNLAVNNRDEDNKSNMGFYVHISYGGFEDPMDMGFVSNLRLHAHDLVNVLVNATAQPFSETVLNDVKILMNEYNSKDHLKSSNTIANRVEESDNEDLSESIKMGGARWDIYRREDVPKLVEYLTKYSDELNSTRYASPKKVVHPLFDEIFYLNNFEKRRLKEEYDVEAWSFEQQIGESVIIPAGCPYQMKKIKSCVNVVVEFISPESVSECIKVSDQIRLLPVNHQAKWHRVQVKNMVIKRMKEIVDEVIT